MKLHVLDASAVMAYFLGEKGADAIAELVVKAGEAGRPLLMSAVNWGEVYYGIWRKFGRETAERKIAELSRLPVEVVDADCAQAALAAEFKAEQKLPYADAFAAALAKQRKAALVTVDADFERVEKDVTVVWAQKA